MSRFTLIVVVAGVSPIWAAQPKVVSVEKIWDQGKHNAFTDLIRWHDKWYCTFREADAHVGGDGQLRVLESADGKKWTSAALIAETGIDLRDPKLSVTPDDRLMIVAGGSVYEGKTLKGRQPRVTFSKDARTWSAPQRVLSEGEWLWRVTWSDKVAYGVSYNAAERTTKEATEAAKSGKAPPGPAEWKLKLVKSSDGVNYSLVTHLDVPGHPNETTLRFLADGEMVALVRREGGNTFGWIGRSQAPYTEWTWAETKHRVGGPNFIRLPDGSLWAGGRTYPGGAKMAIARMTRAGGYDPVLTLPSGGDTSYPGLVWHDGLLWVSYYASHEGKSSIYLAKVRLPLEIAANPVPKSLAPYFTPPAEFAGQFGEYRSPLRFADGSEVKTPDDWKRRRVEIRKTWHDLMGPWPKSIEKPALEVLASERRENFTQNHIRLEIAPGKTTEDAYLLVPDGKGPFPAVVVVFYEAKTGIGLGKKNLRDFGLQLSKRGFVVLSLGSAPETYYPSKEECKLQPLSFHAYVASSCRRALANRSDVDPKRIGIVGHSYGGKWAMFASCLDDDFAATAWSDPGIVFDEKRPNVNYWEPWYVGFEPGVQRKRGVPTEANPRTGPYKRMMEKGMDLHELHALMAPRPFLVSGGSEDPPDRWRALNHTVAVNKLLGYENRVGMTNRKSHDPTEESNERLYEFFQHFLQKE
jgi:hypothetical protein